ncbi:hypothetical protein DFP72DRAFT_1177007 [Ephemerocybe angulata]|uniref:Uncharacterized protein n=1 Tax=Ephemerocybe angulata TaxID=980116 RepID=A0A8H6HDY5_9AGAR|nr:hypothetical protein DFP72DRAFT_1177007 [Tulosesus angulatus]
MPQSRPFPDSRQWHSRALPAPGPRPQEADLTIGAIGYTTTLLALGDTVAHWIAFLVSLGDRQRRSRHTCWYESRCFLAFVSRLRYQRCPCHRRPRSPSCRPTIYTIHVNVRRLTGFVPASVTSSSALASTSTVISTAPVSMSNTPLYETLHRPGAVRRRRRSQG